MNLVLRFINTVAFEARCIRPGFVVPLMPIKEHDIGNRGYPRERIISGSGALPHHTCPVRFGRDALPDAAHRPSRCDTVIMKRNMLVEAMGVAILPHDIRGFPLRPLSKRMAV